MQVRCIKILSPLPGLCPFYTVNPGLTPGATFGLSLGDKHFSPFAFYAFFAIK
jgi:hypothetical protein